MRTDLVVAALLMLLAVAFGLFLVLYPDTIVRHVPPRVAGRIRFILRLIGVLTLAGAALSMLRASGIV